jgi:hypothetical protein
MLNRMIILFGTLIVSAGAWMGCRSSEPTCPGHSGWRGGLHRQPCGHAQETGAEVEDAGAADAAAD